jgi:hypothetical protein
MNKSAKIMLFTVLATASFFVHADPEPVCVPEIDGSLAILGIALVSCLTAIVAEHRS